MMGYWKAPALVLGWRSCLQWWMQDWASLRYPRSWLLILRWGLVDAHIAGTQAESCHQLYNWTYYLKNYIVEQMAKRKSTVTWLAYCNISSLVLFSRSWFSIHTTAISQAEHITSEPKFSLPTTDSIPSLQKILHDNLSQHAKNMQ